MKNKTAERKRTGFTPLSALIHIGFGIMIMIFLSGCGGNPFSSSPEDGASSEPPSSKSKKTTAVYYDFVDVLVPMELKIVKDRTMVVTTPGFRSGVLTLKGRVDSRSLFNFFNNNMQKDNWGIISQIKSPGTTIMVFNKPSRCAVITIRDEQINTYVEIGVAPTVGDANQHFSSQDMSESDLSN
ncbi:hypothetical protein [Desulfospira joergensenii]|uniref:hypothetical protein n=1 Tax=Desulfospira joergensenii TaxID=53329 RepID=UPI0003B35751|nr:hypothetical protein [Desulfospira joergensenii]